MQPDLKTIDKLVQRIVETVHPLRIILFGSAARGEMRPDSDLDVLVIMPEGVRHNEISGAIYRNMINFHFDYSVDIVVATEKELAHYGDNFSLVYYPALKEGRQIYAA